MLLNAKNINMRTVEEDDAKFIFFMRKDRERTKFLSKVDGTIVDQKEWIINYKEREKNKEEFYFVIESKKYEKLGLVRVYDFKDNSFSWGSWLIKKEAPKTTAIESVLQIYQFGFYNLGFNNAHFNVRKKNEKVIAFHQRFGAKIIDENKIECFFTYNKKDYDLIKKKYKRYL